MPFRANQPGTWDGASADTPAPANTTRPCSAILLEVSKGLFLWYLDNVAVYNQVYGSVASVIVLLFWIYLSALILILGAEIGAEHSRMRLGIEQGGSLRQPAVGNRLPKSRAAGQEAATDITPGSPPPDGD